MEEEININNEFGRELNIGLSGAFAKRIRLKPGEGSIPSPSAIIRQIEPDDVYRGYIELLDDFCGCPHLMNNPGKAKEIIINLPKNDIIIVCEIESKIVGTARLLIHDSFLLDGKKYGHVCSVAVLPIWRKKGIGTALINSIEQISKQESLVRLVLSCNESNISYYDKFGFIISSYSMKKDI